MLDLFTKIFKGSWFPQEIMNLFEENEKKNRKPYQRNKKFQQRNRRLKEETNGNYKAENTILETKISMGGFRSRIKGTQK